MKFLHMPKELNDLSDRVLPHWFPMRRSSPRMCGQEDRAVQEAWEGRGPTKHKFDLAWGKPYNLTNTMLPTR